MELSKEYEEISTALQIRNDSMSYKAGVRDAVERCQALANKPVRELSYSEINAIAIEVGFSVTTATREFARAIEAAVWAKQSAPVTVTFRAAKYKLGSDVRVLEYPTSLGCNWEWLDIDGKPQTFEVRLP